MSQEPATAHKYAALSLDQTIGLFLVKLLGWLIRCHETGALFAPADMAQNVTKADELVHAFIRSRAAAQLEHAGYADAARAMRVTPQMQIQGCQTELSSGAHEQGEGAVGPTSVGAPASTQNEPAQGCTPQTPAELLSRLEAIIEQFEQAETIGSVLARIVVCTLAYLTPEAHEAPKYPPLKVDRIGENRRVGLGALTFTPMGQGPPYQCAGLDPGSTPGTSEERAHPYYNSFPGSPGHDPGNPGPSSADRALQLTNDRAGAGDPTAQLEETSPSKTNNAPEIPLRR